LNAVVVDTNVVLVANGQHEAVSPASISICAQRLQAIMKTGKLVIDDGFRILLEYGNKTDRKAEIQPGDAFVKWALRNNANTQRVEQVALREDVERGFQSFPDDPDLLKFDAADRKFVAVASAHAAKPPILQATDSKWLDWEEPLKRHGITVEFICPVDIRRFHKQKFGS
jgi:hypothetical protein